VTEPSAPEAPSSKAPRTSPSPFDAQRAGAYKLFLVGAWLHVVVGTGHLGLAHFPFVLHTASGGEALVLEAMKTLRPMPGTMHSLYDFYVGNSFSAGVLHVALGALCLVAGQATRRATGNLPLGMVVVAVIASWVSVLNALLHFPPPPIALLAISTSCLTFCLVALLKLKRA
jgi:hypothetical protein